MPRCWNIPNRLIREGQANLRLPQYSPEIFNASRLRVFQHNLTRSGPNRSANSRQADGDADAHRPQGTVMTTRREAFRDWVQIAAVIGAALWALWTFVFAEYFKPRELQPHLNITLEMKIAGTALLNDGTEAISIEASIRGENTSQKRLQIASGYLEVFGDKIAAEGGAEFSPALVEKSLNNDKGARSRHYNALESTELVYVATIFGDSWLEPGEKQVFNRVFRIPKRKYHQLEANAYILSGPDAHDIIVTRKVDDRFRVEYVVREKGDKNQNVYTATSDRGRELINAKTALTDATYFLVLPSSAIEPRKAPTRAPTPVRSSSSKKNG